MAAVRGAARCIPQAEGAGRGAGGKGLFFLCHLLPGAKKKKNLKIDSNFQSTVFMKKCLLLDSGGNISAVSNSTISLQAQGRFMHTFCARSDLMVYVVQEVRLPDLMAVSVFKDCVKTGNILSRINRQTPTGNSREKAVL